MRGWLLGLLILLARLYLGERYPRGATHLGHQNLQRTEAYLKSLTDREVWTAFRTAAA
jgi:hypothetical protein